MNTYCGLVTIVGRPNVGKSTLLNHLVGEKISITAHKPQTTRHRIVGVSTHDDRQAVFIDTPGIHIKQKKALNKALNKTARRALHDIDAVIFVIECMVWNEEDELVARILTDAKCPIFLVINKIDLLSDRDQLLPFMQQVASKVQATAVIIPCAAIDGEQVAHLQQAVFAVLPPGPFLYPIEQKTDRDIAFRLAEIIREKLTRILHAELPYALSVAIEAMQRVENHTVVHAIIWVERPSQKMIVIGKQGSVLKTVGRQARLEMNHFLDTKVHLELWVKVRSNWTDDTGALRNLGIVTDE